MPTPRDPAPLFTGIVTEAEMAAAIDRSLAAHPDAFPARLAARNYLEQIIFPRSRRWAFISVGKNASSTTLRFLFEAEFGAPFTTQITPLDDINPSATVHRLADFGVFSRALRQGLSSADLLAPDGPRERLCIVRDPLARAVSGFRYLCKSHRLAARWFARDRLRMNAVVGFDWSTDPDTPRGMEKFLDYLEWQIATEGAHRVDGHWRAQTAFIHPQVFQPTLVGRIEDLPAFFRGLSDRLALDRPPAIGTENRQPQAPDTLLSGPAIARRVRDIFQQDYETFGY